LTFNHIYEMSFPTFCSGIVAAMPNGTVIQARNLDYPSPAIFVKGKQTSWADMMTDVTLTRGGKPLITSVHIPLVFGIHTGMRLGGWSFQQNTRNTMPGHTSPMRTNLNALKSGGVGYLLYVRKLMERVQDFETAIEELYSANFAADSYFVLAGVKPYEAAVLSIDRGGSPELKAGTPPLKRLSSDVQGWHIIQTNDDQDEPTGDERRPAETQILSLTSQQEVSPGWAFEEMHQWPLFNSGTQFIWIAIPATGFHATVLPTEKFQGISAAEESTFLARRTNRVDKAKLMLRQLMPA